MGDFLTRLDHSAIVRVCRPGAAIFDTFQNIQRIDKYVWLRDSLSTFVGSVVFIRSWPHCPCSTGQIRLTTLECKVFAGNRATDSQKQLMSYSSPYEFLIYVIFYVYRILGASLMRQLPHCLVFPGHFATSGKTRTQSVQVKYRY